MNLRCISVRVSPSTCPVQRSQRLRFRALAALAFALCLAPRSAIQAQTVDSSHTVLLRRLSRATSDSARPESLRWVLAQTDSLEAVGRPSVVLYYIRAAAAARLAMRLARDSAALESCTGARELQRLLTLFTASVPRHCRICDWMYDPVTGVQVLDARADSVARSCR